MFRPNTLPQWGPQLRSRVDQGPILPDIGQGPILPIQQPVTPVAQAPHQWGQPPRTQNSQSFRKLWTPPLVRVPSDTHNQWEMVICRSKTVCERVRVLLMYKYVAIGGIIDTYQLVDMYTKYVDVVMKTTNPASSSGYNMINCVEFERTKDMAIHWLRCMFWEWNQSYYSPQVCVQFTAETVNSITEYLQTRF
jgi:hypothetical protein